MWVYVQSIVDTGIGQRVVYQTVKPTNSPDPATTVPVGTGPYNSLTHQIIAQFDNQNPRIWPPAATFADLPTSGVLEGDQCWVIDATAMYFANADGGTWAAGSGGGALTLQQVIAGGVPNNAVTIPYAAPLELSSGDGVMLSLDPDADVTLLSGTEVTVETRSQDAAPTDDLILRSGTSGTSGTGNVAISSGTGATSSGDVSIRTGNGPDVSGNITITVGQAVTGSGGEVSLKGGNVTDAAGTPGLAAIESGYNSAQGLYAPVFVVGGNLAVSTDTDTIDGMVFSNGISLGTNSGLVPTAYVITVDGNPDGHVMSSPGALAIDTVTPGLYQNTDGITSWTALGGGAPSPILWAWNGTDTTQFLAPIDLGLGMNIAGLTLDVIAGGVNGNLLRCASSEINGGALAFPINFAFPRKYVIQITFRELAFTDVAVAGSNFVGTIVVADNTFQNIITLGHLNATAASPEQFLADVAVSSGVPFGPAFVMNGQAQAQHNPAFGAPSTGMTLRYEVATVRPFPAQPQISITIDGSGLDPLRSTRVSGHSFAAPAYPAAWNGITANSIGLMVGNLGAGTSSWYATIEEFLVLKHPSDL